MNWIWPLLPKMPLGFWVVVAGSVSLGQLTAYLGLTRILSLARRTCWVIAVPLVTLVTAYAHAAFETGWLAGMFMDNRFAFLLVAHGLVAPPLLALWLIMGHRKKP